MSRSAPLDDLHTRRVRTLYELARARWYDPFRSLWLRTVSRRAEADVDRLLRDVARPGCRVLDIGCGTGFNLDRLQRLAVPFDSYLGVDLTPAMLAIARTRHAAECRASFLEMDLRALRTLSRRFDLVLCTWVVSHLREPRQAFEIAYDLLEENGAAVFVLMTRPRWYVRWWLIPLVRLFRARYVDLGGLQDLPGERLRTSHAAGLVAVIQLARAGQSIQPAGVTPVTRISPVDG